MLFYRIIWTLILVVLGMNFVSRATIIKQWGWNLCSFLCFSGAFLGMANILTGGGIATRIEWWWTALLLAAAMAAGGLTMRLLTKRA